VLADMSGDGLTDVVVAAFEPRRVIVLRAVGPAPCTLSAPAVTIAGNTLPRIAVADMDADGVLDVVTPGTFLRGTGGGALASGVAFATPPTFINGDGGDVAVAD